MKGGQWVSVEHVDTSEGGGGEAAPNASMQGEGWISIKRIDTLVKEAAVRCVEHVDASERGGGSPSNASMLVKWGCVKHVNAGRRGGGGGAASATSSMFDVPRGMGACVNAAGEALLDGLQQMSWGRGRRTAKRVLTTHFVVHLMGLPHQGSPLIFRPSFPIQIRCNVGPRDVCACSFVPVEVEHWTEPEKSEN